MPLCMDDEATARVCVEIDVSFSFPIPTTIEVDGTREIWIDYDWEPKPCCDCNSFGHEQRSCTPIGAGPSVDTGLGTQEQPDGNVNVMPLVTTRPSSLDASPTDEAASGSTEQATSSGAAQLETALAGGELSTTPVKHAPKQGAKPVYKATPTPASLLQPPPRKG